VARNRKRAKDRRARRPPQAGNSQSGVPSDRSSVPGVLPGVPTVTHEPTPELEPDENGTPDPLEHAMPDAELADAQLAVGRPEPEPDDEADEEEFELEVEESIARGGGGRGYDGGDGGSVGGGSAGGGEVAVPGPSHVEHKAGIFERLIGFLQGSWRELQRVQWPDRRQVMQATGVVIGFVIVAAAFLGLADLVSQKVVTFVLK
jgi:preprotein translocase subunit SecE